MKRNEKNDEREVEATIQYLVPQAMRKITMQGDLTNAARDIRFDVRRM
ncbi:MAG: hypothetical protein NC393_07070 [Clostridium sp.]|nr:hypothetical protein [Clostridium sp.]MCM1207841.1 hypothetical protein [Ruminococcus sp.]